MFVLPTDAKKNEAKRKKETSKPRKVTILSFLLFFEGKYFYLIYLSEQSNFTKKRMLKGVSWRNVPLLLKPRVLSRFHRHWFSKNLFPLRLRLVDRSKKYSYIILKRMHYYFIPIFNRKCSG